MTGWHLIDYPREPDDVGSWLLHNNGEGMLLELPQELTLEHVHDALSALNLTLKYVTTSHYHLDHINPSLLCELQDAFPDAEFLCPDFDAENTFPHECDDIELDLGGEPVWIIQGQKHSENDSIVVFKGVAMTGDIELETLDSCNDEVPLPVKEISMEFFGTFEARRGYRVHSITSAHLNDVRHNVNWSDLFAV